MRLPLIPVLVLVIVCGLIDFYIARAICTCSRSKLATRIHLTISAIAFLCIAVVICIPKRNGDNAMLVATMWSLYSFLSLYVSKFVFVIFDLLSALPRLWKRKRCKPARYTAIGLAAVTFVAMWWGALINRFNVEVKRVDIEIKDLPKSFDGFTVAQISDLHVGTYGSDTTFPAKIVETLNGLNADMIVFTGDIVNRRTDEIYPFVDTFAKLHAPYGVYSILGNHDYGDYSDWQSEGAKQANLQELIDIENGMGWHMLNNATAMIHCGTDSIALIGVENVGDPPFHTYGDLDAAYSTLDDGVTKILLSHNPAHWVTDICDAPDKNIALTLSGHTHAMQIAFGRISPAVFRYRTWGGKYDDSSNSNMLYVNIGVGTVGFPARIGATPEITLFTLKSK
jgi:hypothetical protein